MQLAPFMPSKILHNDSVDVVVVLRRLQATKHAIIDPSAANQMHSMMRPPSTADIGRSTMNGTNVFAHAAGLTQRPYKKT